MQSSRQSASNPSYHKQHSSANIKPDIDKSLVFENSCSEQKTLMMKNPHHVTFFDRKGGEDNAISFFNVTYIPSCDDMEKSIAATNPMCTTHYSDFSIDDKTGTLRQVALIIIVKPNLY